MTPTTRFIASAAQIVIASEIQIVIASEIHIVIASVARQSRSDRLPRFARNDGAELVRP